MCGRLSRAAPLMLSGIPDTERGLGEMPRAIWSVWTRERLRRHPRYLSCEYYEERLRTTGHDDHRYTCHSRRFHTDRTIVSRSLRGLPRPRTSRRNRWPRNHLDKIRGREAERDRSIARNRIQETNGPRHIRS